MWVPTLHTQSPIHPVHSPGGGWHPPGMGHFTAAPARGALTRGPFTHTVVRWVLPGDPGRRQGEITGLQAPAMSQALASSLGRHRGSLLNTHISIQESPQTVLSEPLHVCALPRTPWQLRAGFALGGGAHCSPLQSKGSVPCPGGLAICSGPGCPGGEGTPPAS